MLYSVAPRAGVRARGVLPAAIRCGGAARPNTHAPGKTDERLRFNSKGLPHPLRLGLGSGSNRRGMSNGAIFGPGTPVKEEEAGDEERADPEKAEKNAGPTRRRPFFRRDERNRDADDADAADVTPVADAEAQKPGSILSSRVSPNTGDAETLSVRGGARDGEDPDRGGGRGPVRRFDDLRLSAIDARDAVRDGLTGAAEDLAERVAAKVRKLKSKSRSLTHPPLPVVETFEELLRFARIALLNGEEPETIREFFATTREEVTVMDLDRVQQRVFVATNHTTKTHIISFRGTRNLTNVVQNIRLSSNPVTASGRLAMVGRSLSGSFSFLRGAGAKDSNDSSGSFDEDDECANIDFEVDPSEFARRGCTDHLPMHRGYRVVAKECVDTIAPHIVPGYTIQLTGHSLGGAVAVAVGLLYKAAGIKVGKIVTFGAPKLGPRETREAAAQLNVLRVVQKDDIIPLLPMSRPFVRKPYVHLGEGIMLDNDVPGKYAPLTREWGNAGILWRQRAHLRYAAGGEEDSPPTEPEDDDDYRPSVDATMDATDASPARRARWWQARRRLSNLRTALREAIDRRREKAAALEPVPSAYAAMSSPSGALALSATSLVAPTTPDTEWAAEVAEWAHVPATDADASAAAEEIAPFDDVEGELFVRLAETEGGANAAAVAAASEWERASASMSDDETEISRIGASKGEEPAEAGSSPSDAERAVAHHREGPTIFQRLWQLRGMNAEERKDRLECHRMRRYVQALEAAMEAGPVQTSMAGVYTGSDEDDVGLDMEEEDDDATSLGSVASWVNWTR